MKPVEFEGHNCVFAKDQPQYQPLPARRHADDPDGEVISCWALGWRERLRVLLTGRLWLSQLTFRQLLQPILPSVVKPFSIEEPADATNDES